MTEMLDSFRSAARSIEANPLGRIMYGQRELFHSNLIGWFFDQLPDNADAVFQRLTTKGVGTKRTVERERKNLDLVMRWQGHSPLVIENKVFALPNREQLDSYLADFTNSEPHANFVLLSASEPSFTIDSWAHLSYAELSDRIRDSLPQHSTYEVETMRRYADLASDLHLLISAIDIVDDDEPVWLPESFTKEISSSQMRAALHKARAYRVARMLNGMFPGLTPPALGQMTRATPLVEVLERIESHGMPLLLGWQLQGQQFRRAVVYLDPATRGHGQEMRNARANLSRAHPEFFTMPPSMPQAVSGRKEFNHFAPAFVYRYIKTPHLTISELKRAAIEVHESVQALDDTSSSAARAGHS